MQDLQRVASNTLRSGLRQQCFIHLRDVNWTNRCCNVLISASVSSLACLYDHTSEYV